MPASTDAPFIVESGVGLTDANSLASLVFADSYVAMFGNDSTWIASPDEEKKDALRQASRWLSLRRRFQGEVVNPDQGLAFPRSGMFDENGYSVSHQIVPLKVQQATVELAVAIRKGTFKPFPVESAPSTLTGESLSVGPISISSSSSGVRSTNTEAQVTVAMELLKPFILASSGRLGRG